MRVFNLLASFFCIGSIHFAHAAPILAPDAASATNLDRRAPPVAGSSKAYPIAGTMEVKEENALPFDGDCYAILCLGKEPVFQRDGTESDQNRKDAAANVKIPGSLYVSPEEFPYTSTTQGGYQALLFPVTEKSQHSQGGSINSFYRKYQIQPAHKGQNSWYQITGWTGTLGPYCKALRNNNAKPNKDDAICKPGSNGKGKWGFDVGEYAYTYDGHSYRKAKGSK
ncbi:hypothetical protein BO79DRAFT_143987 [Aspergillus costaricaensis CBS 115574]|uniref:Uncharacterized protein n=1 Tax=Aspergillus costaricaensis CBS 115574 TaxID=1448317 RepID=A0ACD1IJD3_9EURO|nr:hypothetical protein BO79DRAFT_143987 [Aspergillus costaricaensis CBS 115574]RAK90128.1 hypothetical protein BO79DRAFT_143987 [Aspergillus costaricaensis CBS 115574]